MGESAGERLCKKVSTSSFHDNRPLHWGFAPWIPLTLMRMTVRGDAKSKYDLVHIYTFLENNSADLFAVYV